MFLTPSEPIYLGTDTIEKIYLGTDVIYQVKRHKCKAEKNRRGELFQYFIWKNRHFMGPLSGITLCRIIIPVRNNYPRKE